MDTTAAYPHSLYAPAPPVRGTGLRARQDAAYSERDDMAMMTEARMRARIRREVHAHIRHAPRGGRPIADWVVGAIRNLRELHSASVARTVRFGWE